MIARLRQLRRLRDNRAGSVIVEFGILAPAIVSLMLGVLQVGMWMQTYNALRSVAAESGRYVAVEYQKANRISNLQMALWARDRAISDYMMESAQLNTSVVDSPTQSIDGVTEKTLTINYTMGSIMQIVGIDGIPVSFSRPIFVKTG